MKRFTAVLALASLLVATGSFSFTLPAQTKTQTRTQSYISEQLPAYSMEMDPDAVVGSTQERQDAWNSLTSEEQSLEMDDFRAEIEPAVNEAVIAFESQSSAKSYAAEATFGQTVVRNPPCQSDNSASAELNWDNDGSYSYTTPASSKTRTGINLNLPTTNLPCVDCCPNCDPCPECEPGNQPPQVSATASPGSGSAPLTVQFNASASDPDGYIVSYSWDFGDGGTASGASQTHVYQNPGNYTARVTVTDNGGATASATGSITVSSTGSPVDADGDSLPEAFENQLADAFTPGYFVSGGERSGTGFATFHDSLPQRVQQVFGPVPPISNFRVTPVGVLSNGLGVLEIDYLTLWNRDDGTPIGFTCVLGLNTLTRLIGVNADRIFGSIGAHELDNERSAVLVAAPTVNGVHNTDPGAYYLYDVYTAAHECTFVSKNRFQAPNSPQPAGSHVLLALSRSKHATYTFNPAGLPIVPAYIIIATYVTIRFLYQTGRISFFRYLVFRYLADITFFHCFVEHFQNQGGRFADPRTNVGEVARPINQSGFIGGGEIGTKLNRLLWVIQ